MTPTPFFPHDLGGMHGLGPIDAESQSEEPVFHADWERRVFGLTLAAGFLGRWNIDMSRHARERQHPADYLRHSYYQNWFAGLEKLLVETGTIDAEELRTGRPARSADPGTTARVLHAGDVDETLASGAPVSMDVDAPRRFAPGDRVRVVNFHPVGHTRAPRYVRGRCGVIHAHHGVHVFADANAAGVRQGQHLYGLRFSADELWGKDARRGDAVHVDLWEPHLEPV